MRGCRTGLVLLVIVVFADVGHALNPALAAPAGNPRQATPPPPPPPPGGPGASGGQGRRGVVQVMTLTSTAFPDGGQIPDKYTQAGEQASPALAWSNVPDGTASFVLIARDLDAATGDGTDQILHWLLWNIPGSARSLPEGVGQGAQLPDGTRQLSVSGPYYRGPGAAAAGPAHHYVSSCTRSTAQSTCLRLVSRRPRRGRRS
jgi:Raf kinase inhibitor-like YbhB/YbcL family protein